MKKFKVFICIIMSIVLSFSAISVGAIELNVISPIYKGTVALANSGTLTRSGMSTVQDLSGIEVKVYSAEEVVSKFDDGSDFIYYGLTYDHSVYTDTDGAFSFETPSKYFSYSVELSTLPDGYGIDKKSEFCYPNDRNGRLSVSAIASIDTEYSNGDIVVTLYDAQNNIINAEYTVTENTVSAVDYDELAELNEIVYTGTVTTSSVTYEYSEFVDISEMSVVEKIDTLYSVGAISESTQIEYYCYALQDESVEIASSSHVISKIREYQSENSISACDVHLQTVLDSSNVSALTSTFTSTPISNNIGEFKYSIYYDESKTTEMQAEAVETELISIYHYFVTTYGFSAPIPYNNSSHYLIYIVDTGDVLISGGTMGQNDGGVTTTNPSNNTSQIYLHKNVVGGNSIMSLEEVLSHEFFHAIMSTYGYNYFYGEDYSWFKEGSADMAAKNYIGRSTSVFRGHVGSYLETCNQSIFVNSGTRAYGTSVYMDYIYQELGGWAAYKSILDNLSTSNDVYGAISNSSYISTYDAAFLAATTRTYAMDYYYGYQPMEGPVMDIETNTAGQRFFTLPPMAYKFYKIPGNSTVGTLTIECSVSNGTGLQVNVVKKNGTNSYTIATIAYDFTEIVYPVSNFGGTNCQEIALCTVNTNLTNGVLYTVGHIIS